MGVGPAPCRVGALILINSDSVKIEIVEDQQGPAGFLEHQSEGGWRRQEIQIGERRPREAVRPDRTRPDQTV